MYLICIQGELMKKILVMALALGLFPALATAQSSARSQLQKINKKEALSFQQDCNIDDEVIAAAKKVYEANPNNFVAVYNYAVTLSAGVCDDVETYIAPEHIKLAKRLFKRALELKPTSPSSYAGLGFLTMNESGLSGALLVGGNSLDDNLFPNTVKAHQQAAKDALSYYNKALEYKYTGNFLPVLKEHKKALEEALKKIKSGTTKRAVQGRVARRK